MGRPLGREEEARSGMTGRLWVVASSWLTCWGWDGVWVFAQRTMESPYVRSRMQTPQSGEALPPSTHNCEASPPGL